MKKIFRLIAALAAATVAFSCMEEANPETPETDNNAGTHYEGPMTTLEFSVDELTKTSYDKENGHQWSEGDQIKIIWGTEDDAYVIAEVVDGFVTATVGDVETFYAVYPETTVYELTEGQIYVVFPKTQDGSFKQANIMAAKTTKNDKNFAFRNLTHIFKFTLSENAEYKGFQFMSNSTSSEEKGISILMTGVIPVTFNDDEENPVTLGTPITKEIAGTKYELSSVVQAGDLEAGGTYYVGFHPGSNMNYGFGFKATKTGGVTNWSEGALSTAPVNVSRSTITSIPNLDKAIRDNWFFRENGTGDGSSWENAGGADLLVKLLGDELAPEVKYNKNTNGWRLYGADLHLAAGTYTLPKTIAFQIAVNNKTAVYGGYPTTLEGTSLAGRDAAANKTTISIADGSQRLFAGNGSSLYNWIWDGLTFTGSLTFRGGAFYINDNCKGTLAFNDCIFNLTTTDTNGGGAFDFNTSKEFKCTFTNCSFNDCKSESGHGGAIFIQQGANTTITFNKCSFSGNVARCGGAIYNKKSTVVVDNCTFTSNKAVGISNSDGSAIYSIDSENSSAYTDVNANLYIYNSTFYKNSATRQGTVRANGVGYVAIVNSTFNSNTSNNSDCDIFLRSDQSVANAVKGYIISCTLNDGRLYNQSCNAYCYNSIFEGYYANGTNPATRFTNSIFSVKQGSKDNLQPGLYTTENTISTETVDYANLFETYENGITPVKGIALNNGMTFTNLSDLGEMVKSAMPLFETKYLTVDQKGKSREGKTVMGAYVGE